MVEVRQQRKCARSPKVSNRSVIEKIQGNWNPEMTPLKLLTSKNSFKSLCPTLLRCLSVPFVRDSWPRMPVVPWFCLEMHGLILFPFISSHQVCWKYGFYQWGFIYQCLKSSSFRLACSELPAKLLASMYVNSTGKSKWKMLSGPRGWWLLLSNRNL